MKKKNSIYAELAIEKLRADIANGLNPELIKAKSRATEIREERQQHKVVGYVALNEIGNKKPAKVYKRKGNAERTDEIRMQNKLANLQNKFNGKL